MSDAEEVQFKELFSIILAALAGLAVLFLVMALIIGGSEGTTYVPAGMTDEEAVAQRVEPVGEVNMGGPKTAEASGGGGGGDTADAGGGASDLAGGAEVYDAVCASCHAQGVAGAPQTSATDAWQQRLDERGLETLYDHAINGFNGMPAKGGMSSLSEEQVQQAVDYILGEAGLEAGSAG